MRESEIKSNPIAIKNLNSQGYIKQPIAAKNQHCLGYLIEMLTIFYFFYTVTMSFLFFIGLSDYDVSFFLIQFFN